WWECSGVETGGACSAIAPQRRAYAPSSYPGSDAGSDRRASPGRVSAGTSGTPGAGVETCIPRLPCLRERSKLRTASWCHGACSRASACRTGPSSWATLIKLPAEGVTKVHVRFKGGKTETLTTLNPKSSAQQVKTRPEIVEVVDQLLDHHV